MSRIFNIVLLIVFLMSAGVHANPVADTVSVKTVQDSVVKNKKKIIAAAKPVIKLIDSLTLKPFKPDPMKVVWMGAIIPGYGQIMNRKYWKLPIVYGGFLGCAYALTWNTTMYNTYKTAYRDISDTDPTTNSYLTILPKGYTLDMSTLPGTLQKKQETFRRYRDLSIIASIGYYALTLVDAYVDAQLYDFDISPDLSLRIQPTLLENANGSRNTFAMQCCIQLK